MNQTKPKDGFLVWPDFSVQTQCSDLASGTLSQHQMVDLSLIVFDTF